MNDVFISYAHMDDQPLTEGQRGWISQFHRHLEVRLGQLLGYEPKIWRDPQLTGSEVFAETIVHQFSHTKVLVSVLTPRYVKSDWCRKELEAFKQVAEEVGGIRLADKSRIFKVVKTPVDFQEMPPKIASLFQQLLGFDFFEADPETGRVREFDELFGESARRRYYEKVYDLAYEIARVIKEYESGSAAKPASEREGRKTVYLATTTSDLSWARDEVYRELVEAGHTVLPNRTLPETTSEIEVLVRGDLARSDFAVHLIGNRYGRIPEDSQESVLAIQNRLAVEGSEREGFRRVIWIPREVEPIDERQRDWIAAIHKSPEIHFGAEVIQDSLENLKNWVDRQLSPASTKMEAGDQDEKPPEGALPSVYLLYDGVDEAAVEPVEGFLFEQGVEVLHPPDSDAEEGEAMEVHRQNLQVCDAVLIYYGAVRRSWVEIKLRNLMKTGGYGRSGPIPVKAVLIGPPEDARKSRFRTHVAEVYYQQGDFQPEALRAFVDSLHQLRPA